MGVYRFDTPCRRAAGGFLGRDRKPPESARCESSMTGADSSGESERRRKSKCGGPHQCRPPVGWQFVTSIRFPPISFDPIQNEGIPRRPKRREAAAFMDHVQRSASVAGKRRELKRNAPRGIFMRDIGVHMVPISRPSERCEERAIDVPHFLLYPRDIVFDQVPDPKTISGAEAVEYLRKYGEPLLLGPQVMQHRCPQVGRLRHQMRRRGGGKPFDRRVQHRRREVD